MNKMNDSDQEIYHTISETQLKEILHAADILELEGCNVWAKILIELVATIREETEDVQSYE